MELTQKRKIPRKSDSVRFVAKFAVGNVGLIDVTRN